MGRTPGAPAQCALIRARGWTAAPSAGASRRPPSAPASLRRSHRYPIPEGTPPGSVKAAATDPRSHRGPRSLARGEPGPPPHRLRRYGAESGARHGHAAARALAAAGGPSHTRISRVGIGPPLFRPHGGPWSPTSVGVAVVTRLHCASRAATRPPRAPAFAPAPVRCTPDLKRAVTRAESARPLGPTPPPWSPGPRSTPLALRDRTTPSKRARAQLRLPAELTADPPFPPRHRLPRPLPSNPVASQALRPRHVPLLDKENPCPP